jgi:DNA-binding LacI/PurR family transcriptional regulator
MKTEVINQPVKVFTSPKGVGLAERDEVAGRKKYPSRITLTDLASRAGVSVATASRVVNGTLPVRPELEAKVREAISYLGYRAHVSRSNGRKQESPTIGFLTNDWRSTQYEDDFRHEILTGIEGRIKELNGHLMFASHEEDAVANRIPSMVAQNLVSGVIVGVDQYTSREWVESLTRYTPMVLVMHSYPDGVLPSVTCDNEGGVYNAIRYLRGLGHRRIGFLSVRDLNEPLCLHHEERRWAFERHAVSLYCHVRPEYIQILDRDQSKEELNQTIERAVRVWLELGSERPTAVICAAGIYAATFIYEANKHGLEIPHDMSVIGFTNSRTGESCYPPLTCISDSLEEIGRAACDLLALRVKFPQSPTRHIRLSTQLIERLSCAPCEK